MRQDWIRHSRTNHRRRWTHVAELLLHLLLELLLLMWRLREVILHRSIEVIGGKASEGGALIADGDVRRGDTAAVAVIRRVAGRRRLVAMCSNVDVSAFRAARLQVSVESFEKLSRRRGSLRYGYIG